MPGLLELPHSEERRAALAVRATWTHMSQRLRDRATIGAGVRKAVAEIEGMPDEVLTSMVLRHLERCEELEDLRLQDLTHLLSILMGIERATKLSHTVLGLLEEGMEESWYERKLRKQYGL